MPGTAARRRKRLARKRIPSPCSSVAEHSLGKGEVVRSIRTMGTKNPAVRRDSLEKIEIFFSDFGVASVE
jgi:hypothetical protein